jgi:hypothetical protein
MPVQRHIPLYALTDFLDDVREREHALELGAVTMLPKPGMIAILFSAPRIPRRHLQVAIGLGADPHVGPRRRNHQRAEAFDHLGRADHAPVGV